MKSLSIEKKCEYSKKFVNSSYLLVLIGYHSPVITTHMEIK